MEKKSTYQVAIVEDHQFFADCFQDYLRRYEVVSTIRVFPNPLALLNEIDSYKPDIVFMDIQMPEMNGVEATVQVLKIDPTIKVIALTQCLDGRTVHQMLEAGASGYMSKAKSASDLDGVFENIDKDQKFITPQVALEYTNYSLTLGQGGNTSDGNDSADYSTYEIDLIKAIAEGETDKEIAYRFNLKVKSVEYDKRKLMSKMGVKKSTQIITRAFQLGLLN